MLRELEPITGQGLHDFRKHQQWQNLILPKSLLIKECNKEPGMEPLGIFPTDEPFVPPYCLAAAVGSLRMSPPGEPPAQ